MNRKILRTFGLRFGAMSLLIVIFLDVPEELMQKTTYPVWKRT